MSSSDERWRDLADDIWDDFKGSKFVDITPRDAESIARSVLDSPAMRDLLAEERAKALRAAAHWYGVIWGTGVTAEEDVAKVLNRWAERGVGSRGDR